MTKYLKIGKLGAVTAVSFALLFVGACSHHSSSSGCNPCTISGTVSVPTNTFTDSDINDVYATNYTVSNNTTTLAQAIADPAVVGGFVNSPGAGDYGYGGNSVNSKGDTADYYKVSLKSGDKVNLYIADASQFLDLYLYDRSNPSTPVASSTGTTQTQSVTAPATGDYYIEVAPASGGLYASNYNMTVGAPTIAAAAYSVSDDFAPGQVLVRFKDSALPVGIQSANSVANMLGMQYKAGAPGHVMLLGLGDTSQQKQVAKVLGYQATTASQQADATARLKLDTKKAVQALRRRSDVLSADLNYRRHAFAVPTDPNYGSQWDLPMISMPQAWDDPLRGSGAVVAVIDTGILPNHPDLVGQISADGGYDFISDPTIAGDGDGIDPDPTDVGDKVPPETRSSFHGTHVAGTIAALTCFTTPTSDCAGGSVGVASIAPHAKIMPLRVLGKGGGYDSDIIQAMYYAADLPNSSGMTPSSRGGQKADVINMSLGGGAYSQTFQDAVTQVRNAGVIIIAAAGNSSSSTPSYPAAYTGVVSVSAVGPTKALAYYSNYGSTIDVAAPGGDQSVSYSNGILSTLGDDSSSSYPNAPAYTYGFDQGTSMAAPHVAAVAALMAAYKISQGQTLTPAEFDGYLSQGKLTDDISGDGPTVRNDSFGYGLIDASKAITAAGASLNIPPTMVLDKSAVDLGGVSTTTSISVSNASFGSLAGDVTGVVVATDGSSWLSVNSLSASTITTSTPVTFNIVVDRTNLSDGYYSGIITISSTNAPSVTLQVSMYKGSIAGDAGYQYITLVDASNQAQVQQVAANRDPTTGKYSFSFTGVPNGNYYIVSGSDMNNNYVICDAGESCGAYPQTGALTVNGSNIAGIQFNTGYYIPSGVVASLSTGNTAPRAVMQTKTVGGTTGAQP